MSRDNGLLCPDAFRNPVSAFYLEKTSPVIDSPTIISPLTLKSADSGSTGVIEVRGLDGAVPGQFTGAIKLIPGASSVGAAAEGIAIRSVGGGTQLLVGTDSETPNTVVVAGADGISEVYNALYAPVIKSAPIATATGALPDGDGVGIFQVIPTVSGAYMLQVNVNIRNDDSIPLDGIIEWTLTTATGEVQFVSNTLKSTSISKASDFDEIDGGIGSLAEPVDFGFSDLCILQAGVQVSFNIVTARNSAVGGLPWAVQNYQARLIQMC